MKKKLDTAPPGMKGGWFTSYLDFYDVQQSLSVGTGVAVGVAVAVSLVVLVGTTLNVVLSLLAVVAVGGVMMVTLATLVLLGWHLNVLESVTVTVAIGLAVDLTLHYAVAYRLSPEPEREAAVSWAVARLGSPVFMAAATSLAAGIAMLPATVLAYVHVGTFLTVVTLASYIYATFFYLPLLRIFGPEGGCGQLSLPQVFCGCCCRQCGQGGQKHVDKTVYQQAYMSESTLSTSSTSCPPPQPHPSSDTHELEPLTAMRLTGRCGSHSRPNHNSTTRHKVGLAEALPTQDIASPHGANHCEVGSAGRAARSGSLSSSVCGRDHTAFVPRKVSLPSPGGAGSEGGEPSPRHSVAPASSATTILYSEPDTDPNHPQHPSHDPPPPVLYA